MAKARGDSQTGDLLAWEPPKVAAGFAEGAVRGSRIASQISQVVRLALNGHDRADIAERMSDELGYPVSLHMIEKYASEAAEAHKITLERFVALIEATGCVDALAFVAERFDHIVVPRQYGAIIRKHRLRELRERLDREESAIDAELRGLR
ncbi:MAG: DNA transposition protein [Mesorhizobium sp.]